MPNIRISQAQRVEPDYVELLCAILLESFPPEELTDFDEWVVLIAEGKRWLYIAEMNDTLIGVATILPWVTTDVLLLESLAVGREHRNRTVGAQLLQYMVKSVRAHGNVSGIILEVESDEYGDNRGLRARRIAFYARNGAKMVECASHFRSPNAAGGDPLPNKLMWIPLRDNAPVPRGDKLRECVVGILTRDYELAAGDPLLQENLNDLVC